MSEPRLPSLHVVEDDAAVREALCLVLRGEGYEVHAWEDGERFLAEARCASTDLLLLDLGLPGITGAEVAAALARRGERLRTIVLSGLRGTAFDAAVAAIAPIAALRKPLARDSLSAALVALGGEGLGGGAVRA